jgi:hypothetical protein
MALFSLAGAGYQAQDIDLWAYQRDPQTMYLLWSSFLFYQASFALLLGLAFARAKGNIFRYSIPAILAAPLLAHLFAWTPESPRGPLELVERLYVPAAYLLSGFACWLEAHHVGQLRRNGGVLALRRRRLLSFGFGLALLGAYYAVEFNGFLPSLDRIFWLTNGSEEFFLILYLAGIALREFGEQEKLIAKTPVSRYHRLPQLPERVNGALLVVDLKNSELLFRLGAREGDAGKLVDTCVSHLWTAVMENGGVVLQTEGDAIRALFDQETCPDPVAAALRTTDRMAQELALVDGRIRSEHAAAAEMPRLAFRGGVAVGAVKPIWHDFAGTHHASWIEAGGSNAFVESTRLMDLERDAGGVPGGTRVVITEQLYGSGPLAGLGGRWESHGLELLGKHGQPYRIAVYAPVAASAAPAARDAAALHSAA